MAQFVIPARENANQAAIDLYLSVFDTASVDKRAALLTDAGLATAPATKARMLGRRSLTWATAAEVGVHALATVRDPDLLSAADAIVAALRVARGLAEDRRSTDDIVIDELFTAAAALTCSAVPSSTELAGVLADCRAYCDALRTGRATPRIYLECLHTHSNGVCGAVLQALQLVDIEIATEVRTFAVSLGVLYQLIRDLQAAGDTISPHALNHVLATRLLLEEECRTSAIDVVVTHSRLLLQSMKAVEQHYSRNALIDEILLRANITLRDCAALLKARPRR